MMPVPSGRQACPRIQLPRTTPRGSPPSIGTIRICVSNESDARAVYLNFHAPNGGFANFLRAACDKRELEWDNWEPPVDGLPPLHRQALHLSSREADFAT